jgi:hypothetical protein
LIIVVLATAMPTAKAPTIGDNPTDSAVPGAKKNDAVVMASTLPLGFHNFSQ